MKKIAVIYKSHYGSTKQYAEWIADALDATLFEASKIKGHQLMDFDIVVYGGGLYAGGVLGAKLVAKNPCKSLILFTVGLATPEITDFTGTLKAFTPEQQSKMKIFHLRGAIDYSKLGMAHKFMMSVVKKEAEKKSPTERTIDDDLLIETYGKKADFTDKATIEPLVEYVRNNC